MFRLFLVFSCCRQHLSCHIYRACERSRACLTNSLFLLLWRHFFATAQNAKTPRDQINRKPQNTLYSISVAYVYRLLWWKPQVLGVGKKNLTLALWLTNDFYFFFQVILFPKSTALDDLFEVLCRDFVDFPFVTHALHY